jgi:hypothetical protein
MSTHTATRFPAADGGEARLAPLLGKAVIHIWHELAPETQQALFEHAVVIGHRGERDESLREELAKFLHERHGRTRPGS